LPRVEVSDEVATLVGNGRKLPLEDDVDGEVAIVASGRLLAIYRRRGEQLVPERVVSS
jgi:hypothetical protein